MRENYQDLNWHTKLNELTGDIYQKTDSDFLETGKDTFRDDGSTASTAVLVGNHLYVANVGDSRTVISKAGKGNLRIVFLFLGFYELMLI